MFQEIQEVVEQKRLRRVNKKIEKRRKAEDAEDAEDAKKRKMELDLFGYVSDSETIAPDFYDIQVIFYLFKAYLMIYRNLEDSPCRF